MPNKLVNFINDVKVEMRKVSWPTRDELLGSTAVVIVSTFLLAIFIGLCDFVLSRIVGILLR